MNKEFLDLSRETAQQIIDTLEGFQEYEEFTDINRMYRSLPNESLVVRRENPDNLMKTVTSGEPLSIQFAGNSPYANSVVWNPKVDGSRGIDNAFLEGYGHSNGIVTVYGFSRPEGFYLEKHNESEQVFAGVERGRVRCAAGLVPKDAIRFVTIRIPLLSFPKERMTEEEKDLLWEHEVEGKTGPAFVYRGFLEKNEAAHLSMAA